MNNLIGKLKLYGPTTFVKYALSESKRWLFQSVLRGSFSRNSEDIEIHKLLKYKKKGFYVDIGANDPTRLNNTKYFYIRGWRGINIEPDYLLFEKLRKERPDDLNLNIGVGNTNSKLTFYKFFPETLSTFSKKYVRRYKKEGFKLVEKHTVEVKRLVDVLKKHIGKKNIDFMSIDTEGYDEEVLLSNDWSKYRPKIICIESTRKEPMEAKKGARLHAILVKNNYNLKVDNGYNSLYLDNRV